MLWFRLLCGAHCRRPDPDSSDSAGVRGFLKEWFYLSPNFVIGSLDPELSYCSNSPSFDQGTYLWYKVWKESLDKFSWCPEIEHSGFVHCCALPSLHASNSLLRPSYYYYCH